MIYLHATDDDGVFSPRTYYDSFKVEELEIERG